MIRTNKSGAGGLRYAYFVIVVLMLVYMLSFLDRVLISLLLAPIKQEFGLTDTQVGLLIGFGFVLFYSAMGLPFGALADRMNRRNLILIGLLGWSAATSAAGVAAGFVGLLATRALVGVGEATLSPAAISTIGDRFPREQFGLAASIYNSGIVIGSGLAMIFGGYIVHVASETTLHLPLLGAINGWRLAMFLAGVLGLPMTLFVWLTVREAPRTGAATDTITFGEFVRHLTQRKATFAAVFIGYSCAAVASYATILWAPALFMRVHQVQPQEIGLTLGLIVMFPGTLGMIGGGLMSDYLSRRGNSDAPVRVVFWSVIAQIPTLALAFTVSDRQLAFTMLAIGFAANSVYAGLPGATLQLLTPAHMRGRIMAFYLLCVNLFGIGLGPLVVGLLSDHVFAGKTGLASAVATTITVALICSGLILALARRAIRETIDGQALAGTERAEPVMAKAVAVPEHA
ncbi:MFS transporter [Bradyrhizobium sp. KBS0727]|uniref:spinster family MFS transporter n=1 Tax=unclassified Bradyrhizobium TaxID=2631580 RepID=UPI00110E79C2|nr:MULTISPECIES: MFS transporter [unclassified Bradyrhizobium]QDW39835.1 MFS transporter [Bradyrhizobium sp. KBS0725]QDW46438.1 MFS transporter [Bradyrhizobium sp. KBS0727]